MRSVRRISVERMLANAKHSLSSGGEWSDIILKTKERVYDNVAEYIAIEGYPMEGSPDIRDTSINHLVYAAISPMIGNFIRMTGSESIQLQSEKGIASTDGETGGVEEFVVMDLVSVDDEKFILIVEAKRSSLGQAMKQCLLAMKDMRDNNGGVGEVYGFVTTGEFWRMISYDGTFRMTNTIILVFGTMRDEKEKWMKEYSVLVDCMFVALCNGGKGE